VPPDARIEVRAPDDLPPLPAAEDVLARVGSDDPAVRAGAARLDAARARLGAERGGLVPEISLQGFQDHELDATLTGAGLEVELPLWNWNAAGIRQARAGREAAAAHLDEATTRARADALELHGRCAAGREADVRYHDEILPRAERSLRTMEATFRVGESSLMDLLDTRRLLTEVLLEAEATRLEARIHCTALLARIGAYDGDAR
jgi:outer membrane protein, heavy metal efflux system